LFSCCTHLNQGNEPIPKKSSLNSLKKLYGQSIEIFSLEDNTLIEYCPFNACYAFKTSNKCIDELYDFMTIFISLEQNRNPKSKLNKFLDTNKEVSKIINRNSDACIKKTEKEKLKCILIDMEHRYKIISLFVRYDEKTRSEYKIDLEPEIYEW
jgi:hypothetical protein